MSTWGTNRYSANALLEQQIQQAEARNLARVPDIDDSVVRHVGGGVFEVRGKSDIYWVDLNSSRSYPICSCKNFHLSNPTRLRETGRVIRCKHVLKIEEMNRRHNGATAAA
jgi:hypothetical protein